MKFVRVAAGLLVATTATAAPAGSSRYIGRRGRSRHWRCAAEARRRAEPRGRTALPILNGRNPVIRAHNHVLGVLNALERD